MPVPYYVNNYMEDIYESVMLELNAFLFSLLSVKVFEIWNSFL